MPSMPSVTMNAGICSRVISSPFTIPHISPVATPADESDRNADVLRRELETRDVLRRPGQRDHDLGRDDRR